MSIQHLDPVIDSQWDSKIANFSMASFFQSSLWAKVLCASYHYNSHYFADIAPYEIKALIPMMEINSWITGRRGVSLPFSDECEPLCTDSDLFLKLFHEAKIFGSKRSWQFFEFRGGKEWLRGATPFESYFGHRLDLRKSQESLFKCLHNSTKGALLKASSLGLLVEFSQRLDDLYIYDLMCKARRRQGLPPQPYKFFKNIYRYVFAANHGCIALARLEGKPIAGAIFFHFKNRVIYKFAASAEKFRTLYPNNLILWKAILWHQHRGFDILEFGRTPESNHGLRKFKLNWNAEEYKIDYFRYNVRTKNFTKPKKRSSRMGFPIFKLFPISLSKIVGAALYKHVG